MWMGSFAAIAVDQQLTTKVGNRPEAAFGSS